MRVLVGELFAAEQALALDEHGDDVFVAVKDVFADEGGHAAFGGVAAVVIDGREHAEAVLHADVVVVGAVARGDVHGTRAGVGRHELTHDDERVAVEEGVAGMAILELLPLEGGELFFKAPAGLGAEGFDEFAHDDEVAPGAVFGVASDDVGEVGVQRDAEVAGQGPGSRRPDDHVAGDAVDGGIHREGDEDGRGGVLHVLDFGFGEGGVVRVAPLHGLERLVDGAVFDEFGKDAQNPGFVAGLHGDVGVEPVAEDAEAAEGDALLVDEAERELGAAAADLGGLKALEFFDDFGLDGQAVAVPTGDEGGVVAGHGLALDDDVFEHFVQRGAHVHVAVGEGGAVVQDEARSSLRLAALRNSLVELL